MPAFSIRGACAVLAAAAVAGGANGGRLRPLSDRDRAALAVARDGRLHGERIGRTGRGVRRGACVARGMAVLTRLIDRGEADPGREQIFAQSASMLTRYDFQAFVLSCSSSLPECAEQMDS